MTMSPSVMALLVNSDLSSSFVTHSPHSGEPTRWPFLTARDGPNHTRRHSFASFRVIVAYVLDLRRNVKTLSGPFNSSICVKHRPYVDRASPGLAVILTSG